MTPPNVRRKPVSSSASHGVTNEGPSLDMPVKDIQAIFSKLPNKPSYVTQEVRTLFGCTTHCRFPDPQFTTDLLRRVWKRHPRRIHRNRSNPSLRIRFRPQARVRKQRNRLSSKSRILRFLSQFQCRFQHFCCHPRYGTQPPISDHQLFKQHLRPRSHLDLGSSVGHSHRLVQLPIR